MIPFCTNFWSVTLVFAYNHAYNHQSTQLQCVPKIDSILNTKIIFSLSILAPLLLTLWCHPQQLWCTDCGCTSCICYNWFMHQFLPFPIVHNIPKHLNLYINIMCTFVVLCIWCLESININLCVSLHI